MMPEYNPIPTIRIVPITFQDGTVYYQAGDTILFESAEAAKAALIEKLEQALEEARKL